MENVYTRTVGYNKINQELVANSGIVRVARVWLLVKRRRILGLLVDCAALILLWQKLLDFPVVLLDTNGKLKVLSCDGIPVLFQIVSEAQVADVGVRTL